MDIKLVGTALAVDHPARCAQWFAEHFGFAVNVDIGWYVNTQHPQHENLSLDFVERDHPSWPEVARGRPLSGTLIAFLVEDVDAEERRLSDAGVEFALPLVSEPWGQRRFQVAAPEGVFVEVLQLVDPDPEWMAEHGMAGSES